MRRGAWQRNSPRCQVLWHSGRTGETPLRHLRLGLTQPSAQHADYLHRLSMTATPRGRHAGARGCERFRTRIADAESARVAQAAAGDGLAPKLQRQNAIMPRRMVPTSRGGIGVEAGTLLFGEEQVPHINFRLHCHRVAMRKIMPICTRARPDRRVVHRPTKSHDEAEDGTIFQGGGSGKRSEAPT
jgi:hypothetical protein